MDHTMLSTRNDSVFIFRICGAIWIWFGSAALAGGGGDYNGDGNVDVADFAEMPGCLSGPGGDLGADCDPFDFDADMDVDVFDFRGFQLVFGATQDIAMETVTVGNPGNPGETHPNQNGMFGSVGYVFDIGKYEITAGQYTAFLNAVAVTDTYRLYSDDMWTHKEGCRIERAGSPGSYTYNVAPDWANRPVNFVSWGDAVRFANWLHNGQPTGAQDLNSTEDGSYFLNGMTTDGQLEQVVREPDATWIIPSEDEWYKAAYHYNDGATGNYFSLPTGTDSGVSNDLIDPDPGNNATYFNNFDDHTIGPPYYRTEIGAHENSDSPYGTFDQGGNVMEWNEAVPEADIRGLRGGSFFWGSVLLRSQAREEVYHSSDQFSDIGFRVGRVRKP